MKKSSIQTTLLDYFLGSYLFGVFFSYFSYSEVWFKALPKEMIGNIARKLHKFFTDY